MITQAKTEHAKALWTLENEIFTKDDFPMSIGSFYYHIKRNKLFIYMQDNKIIGYVLWLKRQKYYRLYSLGVSKEFRSSGVAQALLTYSFTHLKTPAFTLEVKTTNTNAIKLYEKNGFEIKKLLTGYYPNHRDGYLMKR